MKQKIHNAILGLTVGIEEGACYNPSRYDKQLYLSPVCTFRAGCRY